MHIWSADEVRTRLLGAVAIVTIALVTAVLPASADRASDLERAARTGEPVPGGGVMVEQETTPRAEVSAGATTVGIVADSIGLDLTGDIVQIIEQDFPVVFNQMYLGSAIRHHHWQVAQAVREPGGPDVLAVILGTAETNHEPSSAEFREHMRAFLDDVLPYVDCVRWFDLQTADASGIYTYFNRHHTRLNSLIHQVTAEYDDRVEYVHYGAWTERVPAGYIDIDDLHLARRGRIELGRMIRQAAHGCDEPSNVAGFWDVQDDYWAAEAIDWMVSEGLATGYDNRTYRAVTGSIKFDVTRGQVANMLWRLMDSPAATQAHGWRDGPAWLKGALDWLDETDLADGFPNGTFRPSASITRGSVLRLLWRLAGSPEAATSHGWSDGVPWINPALDWAAEQGLVGGFPDNTFRPNAKITRAQIANLLHLFAPLLDAPPAAPPAAESPTESVPPSTDSTDNTTTTAAAPTTTTSGGASETSEGASGP